MSEAGLVVHGECYRCGRMAELFCRRSVRDKLRLVRMPLECYRCLEVEVAQW